MCGSFSSVPRFHRSIPRGWTVFDVLLVRSHRTTASPVASIANHVSLGILPSYTKTPLRPAYVRTCHVGSSPTELGRPFLPSKRHPSPPSVSPQPIIIDRTVEETTTSDPPLESSWMKPSTTTQEGHMGGMGRTTHTSPTNEVVVDAMGNTADETTNQTSIRLVQENEATELLKHYVGEHWEKKLATPKTGVDERDKDTPDEWIERDPRLVRLTGRHPFNCEPPLTLGHQKGFITPVSLHFVRNHGPVPKLEWDTHRFQVDGAVDRPAEFTMDQLLQFPTVSIPVMLVCAGNRRKEENMIKQSKGFNWGACATSCTVWTGVRLRDILLHCGVKDKEQGARFVCFTGSDDLPQGNYGTSMKIEKAMDPTSDVILAFEQNGRRLTPDHGYPLRVIIPGWIGGRMVKWLRRIEVTPQESQNFYHFFDNRVLPSHVDAEKANSEGWWYKPDYIINDLNINSVIAHPAHDEMVKLDDPTRTYVMKGYAYSGGGRKVIRVEISFDNGNSWQLSKTSHPETPNAYGKYWCWCFWELEVPVSKFMECREVCVRAWDESMNTQPKDLTWNVMGMLNNCYFRIKIHPSILQGKFALRFEHPTVPGNTAGGWMKRLEEKVENKPKEEPAANGKSHPTFTTEEVAKHDNEDSSWIIFKDQVFDCTKYLKDHPGGTASILLNAGTDVTEEFEAIHSVKAHEMLKPFYIGDLVKEKPISKGVETLSLQLSGPPVALDPKKRLPFKLIKKEELSHDTRRFRFALQSPEHVFGLPVGNHVFLSATIEGKLVMRAYTPVSSDDELGYFDLVIKVYFKNVHPAFPEGGKLSQFMEQMQIGDTIEAKGPLGHVSYQGRGSFKIHKSLVHFNHLGFIAGGTGITPCYQIIKAVLKDLDDDTELSLIYANRTVGDILLRDELDELSSKYPEQFHVHYTLNSPPPEWTYSQGFVTAEMFRDHLPKPSVEACIFMCGPPMMIEKACLPNLQSIGHDQSRLIVF